MNDKLNSKYPFNLLAFNQHFCKKKIIALFYPYLPYSKNITFLPIPTHNDSDYYSRMPVKSEQIDKFWLESDFGYIKHQRDSLTTYCSPENEVVI